MPSLHKVGVARDRFDAYVVYVQYDKTFLGYIVTDMIFNLKSDGTWTQMYSAVFDTRQEAIDFAKQHLTFIETEDK